MRSLLFVPFLALLVAACADPPPPVVPEAPPPAPLPVETAAPAPAPPPPPALPPEFADVVIKVQKVAGNVYMLEGKGGNIGVSVGEDGIVLVDDQFAPLAPKIHEALKGITDKPIKVVLNTHWHGDHTGGNADFGALAPIVAHENVRSRLQQGSPAFELGGHPVPARPPAEKVALPVITFQDRVSVHYNGEEIKAIHLGLGHTDGDAIIHFTKSGVVHMGDDFVTYGWPFVDAASGGSIRGLIAVLEKVTTDLPPDTKVIPGHGQISTMEDVKKLHATLSDVFKTIEGLVKKKKTLEQVKEAKVVAKYESLGKGMISGDAFVAQVFKEITSEPKGKPAAAPKAPKKK